MIGYILISQEDNCVVFEVLKHGNCARVYSISANEQMHFGVLNDLVFALNNILKVIEP